MSASVCVSLCVSVSVCLSDRISPEPHARSLPNILYALPMIVARSFSGTLTIGRIAYRLEGGFFSIDNALYSIAFGTHTKTAEPIEMPFGVMSGLGPTNSALCGDDDRRRGRGNLGIACTQQA